MRLSFPYSEYQPIEIPDYNVVGVFEAHESNPVPEVTSETALSLASPVASSRLSQLASGKKKALIITDDYTRQTPLMDIIPVVARELAAAGLQDKDIRILVALGTHRPTTDAERISRFGASICSRFEIIDHDWKNNSALVSIGKTASGAEIRINKLLLECDLIVGIGQIAPHRIAGFSGGSKIIVPGVCGPEAVAHTHWMGGVIPGEKILGVAENAVRSEMDDIALRAGLAFIINAVCDPKGRVVRIVSGNPIFAHRRGCEIARQVFGANVPEKCDIVIADSHPKDIELWQAAKALYSAELIVKRGGVVILVTLCPEGVSRSHPLILERGYKSEAETMEDVRTGKLSNMIVASHCLRVGRIIKDKATGILVSKGISQHETEHLGFIYAQDPAQALDKALQIAGKDATIGVLRNGGEALPLV